MPAAIPINPLQQSSVDALLAQINRKGADKILRRILAQQQMAGSRQDDGRNGSMQMLLSLLPLLMQQRESSLDRGLLKTQMETLQSQNEAMQDRARERDRMAKREFKSERKYRSRQEMLADIESVKDPRQGRLEANRDSALKQANMTNALEIGKYERLYSQAQDFVAGDSGPISRMESRIDAKDFDLDDVEPAMKNVLGALQAFIGSRGDMSQSDRVAMANLMVDMKLRIKRASMALRANNDNAAAEGLERAASAMVFDNPDIGPFIEEYKNRDYLEGLVVKANKMTTDIESQFRRDTATLGVKKADLFRALREQPKQFHERLSEFASPLERPAQAAPGSPADRTDVGLPAAASASQEDLLEQFLGASSIIPELSSGQSQQDTVTGMLGVGAMKGVGAGMSAAGRGIGGVAQDVWGGLGEMGDYLGGPIPPQLKVGFYGEDELSKMLGAISNPPPGPNISRDLTGAAPFGVTPPPPNPLEARGAPEESARNFMRLLQPPPNEEDELLRLLQGAR